ncbi:peptidylprolyl isomerase [Kistimonas scapharcae]|uniref:Peptidyl-prolyl cis-trans isomerase n=1 Tax=Kistimonas scapharcae TaxID=1036133 RepID=A0ABP8V9W4_9GAMM
MTISDQKAVLIHYTLKNDQGEVLDSSAGHPPLAYLHGAGNIIEGLENALVGKQAGDKLQVTVEPAEAYGEYDENLVQEVPMESFAGIETIEPGMQFHAEGPFGPQIVTVTAVTEESVVVDANAPLAGETLHFDVEVVEVRDATKDELEHGHIHGEGCNHGHEEAHAHEE